MARTRHTAPTVLLLAALTAGCDQASDPVSPSASTGGAGVATTSAPPAAGVTGHEDPRLVDAEETPLVLAITNQSYDDPGVGITVTVDGVVVVDQGFQVKDQHTMTFFGLDLPPGEHTVLITSDTGASVTQDVDLPDGEPRWVHVTYWYLDPEREDVTWGGEEQPGPRLVVDVSEQLIPMS